MSQRVCPWWMGYLLIFPLRRLLHNPDKLLAPYVTPGMTVLEIGPGMGFFTLPLARMVGPAGQVICVDIQEKMLRSLEKRAAKVRLADRILARPCPPDSLGLDDFDSRFDFALAFAVVHEIPDPPSLFAQIHRALKPGASCLLAEPRGHVSAHDYQQTLLDAAHAGLPVVAHPRIHRSHASLLRKA